MNRTVTESCACILIGLLITSAVLADKVIPVPDGSRNEQMMPAQEGHRLQDIVPGEQGMLFVSGAISAVPCRVVPVGSSESHKGVRIDGCNEDERSTGNSRLAARLSWQSVQGNIYQEGQLRVINGQLTLLVPRGHTGNIVQLTMSYE